VNEFHFAGFLPRKRGPRRRLLQRLREEACSLVLFVSPHRAPAVARELLEILGNRRCLLARELTKLHEELWRGDLALLARRFAAQAARGELTLVIEGAAPAEPDWERIREEVSAALRAGGESRKDLARRLAERHGVPQRAIYRLSLELDELS